MQRQQRHPAVCWEVPQSQAGRGWQHCCVGLLLLMLLLLSLLTLVLLTVVVVGVGVLALSVVEVGWNKG